MTRPITKAITQFRGPYRWLSNFFESPIVLHNMTYPTAEHAFQSEKTNDLTMKRRIALAPTPQAAKGLGRSVTLVDGWDTWVRYDAMAHIQYLKYPQDSELARLLMNTGGAPLIEGNIHHDKTWGVCHCNTCRGRGHNLLGWLLMRQRNWLNERRFR